MKHWLSPTHNGVLTVTIERAEVEVRACIIDVRVVWVGSEQRVRHDGSE
jgi:hypothetical protein